MRRSLWLFQLAAIGCQPAIRTPLPMPSSTPQAEVAKCGVKGDAPWAWGPRFSGRGPASSSVFCRFTHCKGEKKGDQKQLLGDSLRRKPSECLRFSPHKRGMCIPLIPAPSTLFQACKAQKSHFLNIFPVANEHGALSQLHQPSPQWGKYSLEYSLAIVSLISELLIDQSQLCHVLSYVTLGQFLNPPSLHFHTCNIGVTGPISQGDNSNQTKSHMQMPKHICRCQFAALVTMRKPKPSISRLIPRTLRFVRGGLCKAVCASITAWLWAGGAAGGGETPPAPFLPSRSQLSSPVSPVDPKYTVLPYGSLLSFHIGFPPESFFFFPGITHTHTKAVWKAGHPEGVNPALGSQVLMCPPPVSPALFSIAFFQPCFLLPTLCSTLASVTVLVASFTAPLFKIPTKTESQGPSSRFGGERTAEAQPSSDSGHSLVSPRVGDI